MRPFKRAACKIFRPPFGVAVFGSGATFRVATVHSYGVALTDSLATMVCVSTERGVYEVGLA